MGIKRFRFENVMVRLRSHCWSQQLPILMKETGFVRSPGESAASRVKPGVKMYSLVLNAATSFTLSYFSRDKTLTHTSTASHKTWARFKEQSIVERYEGKARTGEGRMKRTDMERGSKWLRGEKRQSKERQWQNESRGTESTRVAKWVGLAAHQCTQIHSIWDESIL